MSREVDDIVHQIARMFPTFGGGRLSSMPSPLALWMKDGPLKFALGVDVRDVVEFVLSFRQGSRDQPASADAVREDVASPVVTTRDKNSSSPF